VATTSAKEIREVVEMAAPRLEELPACPVETTLSIIRSKWQVLILRDLLMNGTMRFKELQRSIGKVSQKVLTDNLRAMEDFGIVHREVFAEVPPRVEYSLTETGRTLQPVLDAMWAWGEGYKERLRTGA
jgi:DNA-binding HxlR family transcriptional regulator